jgi:uncharacterized repeat protein (TIGR03837 family)
MMIAVQQKKRHLHLFCRVIDNYGDIGVCWRLCKLLHFEHGIKVDLWVDDLASFQVLCPAVRPDLSTQKIEGVTIHHWTENQEDWRQNARQVAMADVVIEAFACNLPEAVIMAMAAMVTNNRPPVWINVEYLSAEPWVESCHGMLSIHPKTGLKKHFFFPGMTSKTGGLIFSRDYKSKRDAFLAQPTARREFLSELGMSISTDSVLVSLFCYAEAPVAQLLEVFAQAGDKQIICAVPVGVATAAVENFLGQQIEVGSVYQRGHLQLHVLPFVSQTAYDRLLWCCDLNFVRGEDSFVRAQLAGKPFVWQIYPQQEDAHAPKLEAFLNLYGAPAGSNFRAIWAAWNLLPESIALSAECVNPFEKILAIPEQMQTHAEKWADNMLNQGDFASQLVQFIQQEIEKNSAKIS